MSLREELQKRIEKKQAEIRDYNDRIREANAYLQGLQDTLKLIPKEDEFGSQEVTLRHGSNIAKARDVLKAAGKPLHITEILKAMGQSSDKKHRLALAGSIAAYARKGMVFTKPAPNTFGLVDSDKKDEWSSIMEIDGTGNQVLSGITGSVKVG
jgi:hypothetical protein